MKKNLKNLKSSELHEIFLKNLKLDVNPRRDTNASSFFNDVLKNEGLMVQTCRNIKNSHVLNTVYYFFIFF